MSDYVVCWVWGNAVAHAFWEVVSGDDEMQQKVDELSNDHQASLIVVGKITEDTQGAWNHHKEVTNDND